MEKVVFRGEKGMPGSAWCQPLPRQFLFSICWNMLFSDTAAAQCCPEKHCSSIVSQKGVTPQNRHPASAFWDLPEEKLLKSMSDHLKFFEEPCFKTLGLPRLSRALQALKNVWQGNTFPSTVGGTNLLLKSDKAEVSQFKNGERVSV